MTRLKISKSRSEVKYDVCQYNCPQRNKIILFDEKVRFLTKNRAKVTKNSLFSLVWGKIGNQPFTHRLGPEENTHIVFNNSKLEKQCHQLTFVYVCWSYRQILYWQL